MTRRAARALIGWRREGLAVVCAAPPPPSFGCARGGGAWQQRRLPAFSLPFPLSWKAEAMTDFKLGIVRLGRVAGKVRARARARARPLRRGGGQGASERANGPGWAGASGEPPQFGPPLSPPHVIAIALCDVTRTAVCDVTLATPRASTGVCMPVGRLGGKLVAGRPVGGAWHAFFALAASLFCPWPPLQGNEGCPLGWAGRPSPCQRSRVDTSPKPGSKHGHLLRAVHQVAFKGAGLVKMLAPLP